MADRLRRAKDILKNRTSDYLEAVTKTYAKYQEGSPTYITYYQFDANASSHDQTLEAVDSLIGNNSPKKYKKIFDVIVYGVDALDISNQLSERGLLSTMSGELVFIPNTVRPYPGDFFVFDYEGLEEHLFKITDVQYDKASPNKYFKCQYTLSQYNVDEIEGNTDNEEYTVNYDTENGSNTGVITKADAALNDSVEKVIDSLIDKYTKLFYNDDLDTFVATDYDTYYWCPYLQHFLHETKALDKNEKELLTEIYIMDINEADNHNIYQEKVYRESLFRSVEIQNSNLSFPMNFIDITNFDLKSVRNLPFFNSPLNFKMISPIKNELLGYKSAANIITGDGQTTFDKVDHKFKLHIMDDLHLQSRIQQLDEMGDEYKVGDVIYECRNHELEPTGIFMTVDEIDPETFEKYIEIKEVGIDSLMKTNINRPELELFNIIKSYLNGTLEVSEDLLNMINSMYYESSIKNYIFLPLVIFALKSTLKS